MVSKRLDLSFGIFARRGEKYSCYDTTATTKADALSSVTTSTSLLNAPAAALTKNSGRKGERSAGLSVNGTGDYRNETLITNPRDVSFLTTSSNHLLPARHRGRTSRIRRHRRIS